MTEKVEVLEIEKEAYEQIVKQTQISVSEKKIDFLIRFVPKFRSVSRNLVEEMEIFFVKEVASQGFLFQRQDEQDDYIYFIFRGRCRVLLSTHATMHQGRALFPTEISQDKTKKQAVIGYLGKGDSFGEHSAINDLPNPFSVEALSPKVEVYKILRAHFIKYFGGL